MRQKPDNRLGGATSPYLHQHAGDPVDWRPWGEAAFREAAQRGVPLLISIGYSSCHWCHVMGAETFSDPAVGELLRRSVVAVKVDREELPTVDSYYVNAAQALRQNPGWPLTVFADERAIPFYIATYLPPEPRPHSPSFTQVVRAVTETHRDSPDRIAEVTKRLGTQLVEFTSSLADLHTADDAGQGSQVTGAVLDGCYDQLVSDADFSWGGFGCSPKFPPLASLLSLTRSLNRSRPTGHIDRSELRRVGTDSDVQNLTATQALGENHVLDRLRTIRRTFLGMASGGIRDQLAGGICRYSVDARWEVPHFEKLLSDNALYLRATASWCRCEVLADPESVWAALAARELRDTAEFLAGAMSLPGGGFATSFDADAPAVTVAHADSHDGAESRGDADPNPAAAPNAPSAPREGAHMLVTASQARAAGTSQQWKNSVWGLSSSMVDGSGRTLTASGLWEWVDRLDEGGATAVPWESSDSLSIAAALRQLRAEAPAAARDDKLIVEHNGLAVTAMFEAAALMQCPEWAQAAHQALWVMQELRASAEAAGRPLPRSASNGSPGPGAGTLADHVALLRAELAAHQYAPLFGLPAPQLDDIAQRTDTVWTAFTEEGGAHAHLRIWDGLPEELLPARAADPIDAVTPSGRSVLAELCGQLAILHPTPQRFAARADTLLGAAVPLFATAPSGAGWMAWVAESALAPVVVTSSDHSLLAQAAAHPATCALSWDAGDLPAGFATVCRGEVCSLPLEGTDALVAQLSAR